MNAAGPRDFSNQTALLSNEEAIQNQFNSLQQMPSAKRSFSAEGTVKRGSKFRTTMRNEFLNAQNKNANHEEETQQKKTTKVVLKRYNSAFPKDFFGNVKKGGEQVQQSYHQNDSTQVLSQGLIPTGYNYNIRQDSYQFLQQQQQQQQQQFQNDNQGLQNNNTHKLTRQQMQLLSQSQYLHQNMYLISQNSKQVPSQHQQYPQLSNLSSMQNSSSQLQQHHPTSQSQKYRCQSEADSPLKKSAYDILDSNNRNPLVTQSEQKNNNQYRYPSNQNQALVQAGGIGSGQQYSHSQQQQINYAKSNPSSNTFINYNYSYNQNNNNYPSSQISGENSPLKESKFNNQTAFSTASSSIPFQWKHIFSNNSSSSASSSTQQVVVAQKQYPGVTSNLKNQLKSRQNIPPKPQFQHQNHVYCKTEQNEEISQQLSNNNNNKGSNTNTNNINHSNNLNFIELLRGSINHDTPKFISDESTTQSTQQPHLPNSFTAAIIQQQLMQKLQNVPGSQNENRSSFSNAHTQSEKKPKQISSEHENHQNSYHIQIKQKRKAQPTRSHSEIKLSNSTASSNNLGTTHNLTQTNNKSYQDEINNKQKQNKIGDNQKIIDKQNNPNYATFSSSLMNTQIIRNNEDKVKNPPRIIQSDSQKRRISNSTKILEKLASQKQQPQVKTQNNSPNEDSNHLNQSRQFFDMQYQISNSNGLNIQNENGFDNRQLLNKDYSCYQFNLQPLPTIPHNMVQSEDLNNPNVNINKISNTDDDKNGKENLINQINNIFHSTNSTNNQSINSNNQNYQPQHNQKSNYLNLLANAHQSGLIKKVSSNSSSNNSTSNASRTTSRNNDQLLNSKKLYEETKGSQQSERYSNEFIDDHLRELEKARKSSEAEEDSSKNVSRRRSSLKTDDQKSNQGSLHSSTTKKNRIKVIYPAQLDGTTFAQSSHLRTQSEANLSTKKNKSPIKPFPYKHSNDINMENSVENSVDNFSPVHFHRMHTEADKDSESFQNNTDFSRKIFSVSSLQQFDQNPPEQEQKRRVRKPKSYHSQEVFNLNSSETKKKLNNISNQSSSALNIQDNVNYNQSSNLMAMLESTNLNNHQNNYIKEKPYESQQQQSTSVASTTTLPKIYTHQNTYLQTKNISQKNRIRFNSYHKAKTENSPTHQDNSDILSQTNVFTNNNSNSNSNGNNNSNNNMSSKKTTTQFQSNQKNNTSMKLSDFISLKEKKQNQYSSESESRKLGEQESSGQQVQNQQNLQTQSKTNPFLQSNLNPNQFEFSFRNNICQKEAENQISQQINKHKIQNEQQIPSRNSVTSNNSNLEIKSSSQQQQLNNQMLLNIKLNLNNQQSTHSKDASSIKLSSNQLKQPNKFFSDKKQLISQNLKTDFS